MSYSPLGILSLVKPTIPLVPTVSTTTVRTATVPTVQTFVPLTTVAPAIVSRPVAQDPAELFSPTLLPSYTPPEALVATPITRVSTVIPVTSVIPAVSPISASVAVPITSSVPIVPTIQAVQPVPVLSSSTITPLVPKTPLVPVLPSVPVISVTSSQGSVPMDRRQAVSYLQTLLNTSSSSMLMKAGTVCSNTKDPVICAQRIVSTPTSAFRVEYKRLLKEIYTSYGKTELDALYSFVYGFVKTKTGMGDDWLSMYLNPDYKAVTSMTIISPIRATLVEQVTTPSATVSRVLTNPADAARVVRPSTTEVPIVTTPTTSYTEPAPRPDGSVEYAGGATAFDMAETRTYEGYQYRALPEIAKTTTVTILSMVTKIGVVEAAGKSWTKVEVVTPPPSGAVMGDAVYNEIVASGKAVIIAKESVDSQAVLMYGTDDIAEASDLTMNNEFAVVLSEPATGWKKPMSKALIYGGVAVAAVAGIGLIYYMTRK